MFGESLDIHFGGFDLKFPHHQCEIAQCEACFDSDQWTNYWIHSGEYNLRVHLMIDESFLALCCH